MDAPVSVEHKVAAADREAHRRILAGDSRADRRLDGGGILPVIDTAIANRQPGRGQIGAGVVRAPMACFERAAEAYRLQYS